MPSSSERQKLVTDHTEVDFSERAAVNGSSVKRKKKRRRSHKHFRHKEEQLNIDFVLVAKNFDENDQMSGRQRELEECRKTYFHNLKKKRLVISKPYLSSVSNLNLNRYLF